MAFFLILYSHPLIIKKKKKMEQKKWLVCLLAKIDEVSFKTR